MGSAKAAVMSIPPASTLLVARITSRLIISVLDVACCIQAGEGKDSSYEGPETTLRNTSLVLLAFLLKRAWVTPSDNDG